MKRLLKWLLAAGVLLGGGWLAHALWKGHAYAQAYAEVARGDSQAHVLQLFGTPHRVTGQPEMSDPQSNPGLHWTRHEHRFTYRAAATRRE